MITPSPSSQTAKEKNPWYLFIFMIVYEKKKLYIFFSHYEGDGGVMMRYININGKK